MARGQRIKSDSFDCEPLSGWHRSPCGVTLRATIQIDVLTLLPPKKIAMSTSYLLAGCRTPIGKLLGTLSSVPATKLGAIAVGEAVRRASLAVDAIEEVIMGNVLSAGLGQAPARQAALYGGLPDTVAALTINKMCGSGLKAVMLADQAIRAGDAKIVVAGGMESMSQAPFLISGARQGWKFGDQQIRDSMLLRRTVVCIRRHRDGSRG